jgi:NTE family protein
MQKRALVLGGGGVTGVAWEIGLIAGLAEQGIDLAAADVIVGTSAGSFVGADVAAGTDPQAMYEGQLLPPDGLAAARLGAANLARLLWIMLGSRDPVRARVRMGKLALAARTESEASRRMVFEGRLAGREWPDRLQVTAVDARSGEFTVFAAEGPATLIDAVGASCAVPGVWPPVTIGDRRFIDGGMRSAANADLAAGYERVVIFAPVTQGIGHMASPARQAAGLTAAGASVIVLSPDAASLKAIGRNVLDPARRAPAARAGRAQAAAAAGPLRALWLADPVRPAGPVTPGTAAATPAGRPVAAGQGSEQTPQAGKS